MKTDFEILAIVYAAINVPSVKNTIDGEIYNGDKPVSSKLQDITLNCLTNMNAGRGKLQNGVLNINCWCIERDNGVADNGKLNEISSSVINALSLNNNDESQINGLLLKRDNIKTFRDSTQSDMFYTNIRLIFTYKN